MIGHFGLGFAESDGSGERSGRRRCNENVIATRQTFVEQHSCSFLISTRWRYWSKLTVVLMQCTRSWRNIFWGKKESKRGKKQNFLVQFHSFAFYLLNLSKTPKNFNIFIWQCKEQVRLASEKIHVCILLKIVYNLFINASIETQSSLITSTGLMSSFQ